MTGMWPGRLVFLEEPTGVVHLIRSGPACLLGGGLVEVEIETGGPLAGGVVAPVVISWPNGVRVELGVDAVSGAVLSAMHVAFGGGSSCLH